MRITCVDKSNNFKLALDLGTTNVRRRFNVEYIALYTETYRGKTVLTFYDILSEQLK